MNYLLTQLKNRTRVDKEAVQKTTTCHLSACTCYLQLVALLFPVKLQIISPAQQTPLLQTKQISWSGTVFI